MPDRADLLWGATGGLAFLVLIQGYELVAAERVGVVPKLSVALAVGVASAALTRVLARWLLARNGRA